MDQQFCNDSGDQNWKFPAGVSEQAKQSDQLNLSSSEEGTQSTTETIGSGGMETWRQPPQQIPECDLNNRIEVEESVAENFERNERSENGFMKEIYPREITVENFFKIVETWLPLSEEDKHQIIRGYVCRNLIDNDPFSEAPDHAINITTQDNDLTFGIVQDIGTVPAKEDAVSQFNTKKNSKPFTILRSISKPPTPPTPKITKDRKKRGPKPSFSANPNVEPGQLKIRRSHKKKHPVVWQGDMHTDLERNSEQPVQLQIINSDYDFGDYFRSSTDKNSPYASTSMKDINEIAAGFWLNPECNEVLNTDQMERKQDYDFKVESFLDLGLTNNNMQNCWIPSHSVAIIRDPSITIAQPFTSEPKATKVKKSKADPRKKIKTTNSTPSSQTFASKKSSPFNSSTQMDSENESGDEYSKSQNKREAKRKPKNIQNKALNAIINGPVNNLPPLQLQSRQATAFRRPLTDDEISKLTFGTSDTRRSFFTVVVNQMFALLKDQNLGKEFRDAIKQEAWFKYLVKRENMFESVVQAYENSENFLQKVESSHEVNRIAEELNQGTPDFLRKSEESKWFQEALNWKSLQSVIRRKKWAKVNKKELPQDQCNKCSQDDKCDECREFKNLYVFLHAIYKKGINEKGEESGKIRSLERLSEVVGNERFSEADNVIEMDLKEFCQKAASSVMATFLKEEEEFFQIAIQRLYVPQRKYKKNNDKKEVLCDDDEKEVLCDDDKKKLHLRFKSDIRERFATPKNYPKISAKK